MIPMDIDNRILKIPVEGGSYRRIPFGVFQVEGSLQEMRTKIAESFSLEQDSFIISYKDEENDTVVLQSDEDLSVALTFFKSDLKLSIQSLPILTPDPIWSNYKNMFCFDNEVFSNCYKKICCLDNEEYSNPDPNGSNPDPTWLRYKKMCCSEESKCYQVYHTLEDIHQRHSKKMWFDILKFVVAIFIATILSYLSLHGQVDEVCKNVYDLSTTTQNDLLANEKQFLTHLQNLQSSFAILNTTATTLNAHITSQRSQFFPSNTTNTFSIPDGVTHIFVTASAGGGGGGSYYNYYNYNGGGGGGGGAIIYQSVNVIPGESLNIIVGGGGKFGGLNEKGQPGGNTMIGSYILLEGGGGGDVGGSSGGGKGGQPGGTGGTTGFNVATNQVGTGSGGGSIYGSGGGIGGNGSGYGAGGGGGTYYGGNGGSGSGGFVLLHW